eukprot:15095.XXX_895163_894887_1 [CDS] Oithona nana genome sequencing.
MKDFHQGQLGSNWRIHRKIPISYLFLYPAYIYTVVRKSPQKFNLTTFSL